MAKIPHRLRKWRLWTDDELVTASELARDGFPAKSIGKHLGRSEQAVLKQLELMGISLLRGETKKLGLAIKQSAFAILQEGAEARGMEESTWARILLELLLGSPPFLAQLVDDDVRSERHPALELTDDPRPTPSPPTTVVVAPVPDEPPAPAQPFSISMFSPVLQGTVMG